MGAKVLAEELIHPRASPALIPEKKLDKTTFAIYIGGMKTQNQIKRSLGRPDVIEHIKKMLNV
ncbi:MAG: hypothetical protein V1789_06290, partial [PVC group bacterium]